MSDGGPLTRLAQALHGKDLRVTRCLLQGILQYDTEPREHTPTKFSEE